MLVWLIVPFLWFLRYFDLSPLTVCINCSFFTYYITDEERVLREGWTEMRSDMQFQCMRGLRKRHELVFNAFCYFDQWRKRDIGVMWDDLGALTTARAREFWICWRRVIWDLGGCSRVWSEQWKWKWCKQFLSRRKDGHSDVDECDNSRIWT